MPDNARCPKCGHHPVHYGQVMDDKVIRTVFFCPVCEHRWSSTDYPRVPLSEAPHER